MDVAIMGILLPIIIALGAFVMVVYIRKFENIERMAMIEKGLAQDFFKKDRTNNPSPVLRWALLLIGSGIGLIVGYMLDEAFHADDVGYFSMLMIFGGLGLMLAYIIEERKAKKADQL